ncbi:hypothetical protein Pfo_014045 [Paulownia fortunei]|nr:hypothetical protein Pfo_014045 [Paulownia fortunei]
MDEHRIFSEVFFGSDSTHSGVVSDISQQDSDSACHTLTYRLVESSGEGVTSCCYQLKQLLVIDKGCEVSGRGGSKNRLSGIDENDQKEAVSRVVAPPISQESYASKLLIDPSGSAANKLGTHRPTKPKWKDSSMPRDKKNDPQPLLRYHIHHLLRAAGWVIGRRKRNSKYNGIGEYVYKSPGGRPIREFYRAWCMCGESLTELWTDLSLMVKEIENKLNLLETTSDMAHLWCLLDPFANVVFIEKTICLLKEGIAVKAKRSLVIPSDVGSTAKYRKNSKSERSCLNPRPALACGGSTCNQICVNLFGVPISSGNAPELLGGPETVIPHQGSITSSPSFDQGNSEKEGGFGCIRKAHKRSRKISEMKLTGNHFGETAHYPIGEISGARCGSKTSKACDLHDDDLLISAIIKTKTFTPTKKCCRLLPTSLKKGARHIIEGKWSAFESRTVSSGLIHSGVVSLNEIIQYRNPKVDAVIKDGLITRDGILASSHWNFNSGCIELPEGSWYYPQCCCQICGDAVNDKETYHETCMQVKGMKIGLISETWFCGESCQKTHIGLTNLLSKGFFWTLLRCIPGDQKAECNSKLAVAVTIMEECFLPMVDIKTGIDMIPQVIYNWESQFAHLNYNCFYTVALEKDDVVLSVASIRIHGVTVAELPLVATAAKIVPRNVPLPYQMLKSLKVEKLIVSSVPSLVETWIKGFGFQPLEEDERRSLSKINLMVLFPGSVWLEKHLYESHTMDEKA